MIVGNQTIVILTANRVSVVVKIVVAENATTITATTVTIIAIIRIAPISEPFRKTGKNPINNSSVWGLRAIRNTNIQIHSSIDPKYNDFISINSNVSASGSTFLVDLSLKIFN